LNIKRLLLWGQSNIWASQTATTEISAGVAKSYRAPGRLVPAPPRPPISSVTVGRCLEEMGYTLRANVKTR